MRVLGFPVAADRVGAVEVGEHEDPEQFGAGSESHLAPPDHTVVTVCENSSDLRLEVG